MPSKHILIFFPYAHLAYSPTILNLCTMFHDRGHRVKVVYGIERFWGQEKPAIEGLELQHVEYSEGVLRLVGRLNKYVWKPIALSLARLSLAPAVNRLSLREILLFKLFKRATDLNSFDEIIAVDLFALFAAQRLGLNCHFISLEVEDGTQFVRFLNLETIKSVVIQSKERLDRIFGGHELRSFIVQNSPFFVEPKRRTRASIDLIYNGSAWPPFGAFSIIEFSTRYPEYKVHFKGSIHPQVKERLGTDCAGLLNRGSLSFSESYMSTEDLRDYLADYSIGFCFYDFDYPDISRRRFNYETAPSGKVFLYLSVGMPVVATRIQGFAFLESEKAGILVNDHKPESIKRAVDAVLADYAVFSDNALALGKRFSFDRLAQPFVDLVGDEGKE